MTDRQTPPPPGLALRFYRLVAPLIAPFALARARKRLLAEDIPETRFPERKGIATLPRPSGKLVWFHAASIGESLSILPLVEILVDDATVLVTTGTATSAKLLSERLPEGAFHQFVPIDTTAAARRFQQHWQPDIGVFVESEVWPNLTRIVGDSGTPLMLINARLSRRTLARWQSMPKTARALFSRFARIITQDQATLQGLTPHVSGTETRLSLGGNMKAAAKPLPVDEKALAHWRGLLGARTSWVASSTHDGEDALVLEAHAAVRATHPETLLILVPRHPHRGPVIAEEARAMGFAVARLDAGDPVTPDTSVLVADTLGQLGLWYRLSPIVLLAGSFGQAGGHNPWEPIALDAVLLHGPHVKNAEPDYRTLQAAGAATELADASDLGAHVSALLASPDDLARRRAVARTVSTGADGLVESVAAEIRAHLRKGTPPR